MTENIASLGEINQQHTANINSTVTFKNRVFAGSVLGHWASHLTSELQSPLVLNENTSTNLTGLLTRLNGHK